MKNIGKKLFCRMDEIFDDSYWFRNSKMFDSDVMYLLMKYGDDETLYIPRNKQSKSGIVICFEV